MDMDGIKLRKMTISGLMIALVVVATLAIQIPTVATGGYIHLGDSMILIAGYFMGPVVGFLAGGIGSGLADVISGHSHWMVFSFLIKGIMGALMGVLSLKANRKKFFEPMVFILPVIVEIVMVIGYFLAGAFLKGSFMVSLTSVPSNIVQGIGGVGLFLIIGKALSKTNIKDLSFMKGDNVYGNRKTTTESSKEFKAN